MKPSKSTLIAISLLVAVVLNSHASFVSARISPGGVLDDDQASLVYWTGTGELAIDAPIGREFTSINIDSASSKFTGDPAKHMTGSFDSDRDSNIFHALFGDSFGSISFGNVDALRLGAMVRGVSINPSLASWITSGMLRDGGTARQLIRSDEPGVTIIPSCVLCAGIGRQFRSLPVGDTGRLG